MSRVLLAIAVVVPVLSAAQEVPTVEEFKKVRAYLENGKEAGPLLTALVPCVTVDTKKGSATQWDCTEPVNGTVKKGTAVHAWMSWAVPKGAKYEDITIQWTLDGTVRTTSDLTLEAKGEFANPNHRTYKSSTLAKAGTWEIKVQRDGKDLGSASFVVE